MRLFSAIVVGWMGVAAQTPPDAVVTWRDEPRTVEALAAAADIGAESRAAIESWSTWATKRGYRLVLNDTGRVLLVFSETYGRRADGKKEDNTVQRFLRSVDKTILEVDRLLPPSGVPTERSKSVVVVVGARQEDYADVAAAVVAQSETLREWATADALGRSGFVLSDPLVAAWLEDPPDTEEWNPENELVHRVAAELILRHAPYLPGWLQAGLTWHVEERVMKSIYCFPYRNEFVSIYDHTDWHTALMQMFKNRRKEPLQLEEVARWNPRKGFTKEDAYLAFGVARYLADFVPASIPPVLTELSKQIVERRKVPTGDFTWKIDPDFQLPTAEQLGLIEKHAGTNFLEEVTKNFIAGKKYRPPAKSSAPGRKN